jgi:hypothetical protein
VPCIAVGLRIFLEVLELAAGLGPEKHFDLRQVVLNGCHLAAAGLLLLGDWASLRMHTLSAVSIAAGLQGIVEVEVVIVLRARLGRDLVQARIQGFQLGSVCLALLHGPAPDRDLPSKSQGVVDGLFLVLAIMWGAAKLRKAQSLDRRHAVMELLDRTGGS